MIRSQQNNSTARQGKATGPERRFTMMTRKDLNRLYNSFEHCKVGYCCYQEDGKGRCDLTELGYNRGVYGWNWTAYADFETGTLYISCYRNVPAAIVNK